MIIPLPSRPSALARPPTQGKTEDRSWYSIKDVSADEVELSIYDEIGAWGIYASDFLPELQAVVTPKITVRINSPGGDVFDGIAIMNALAMHPAHVTVSVDGIAASIASVVAMAGDQVIMQPHSQMMIHDALGFTVGNAKDHQIMADLLGKVSDNIAGVYADKAGGDVAGWRELMLAETWMTDQEAVDLGLADQIGNAEPNTAAPPNADDLSQRWIMAAYKYPGRLAAPEPARPVAVDVAQVRAQIERAFT